jgi:transposase
LSRGDLTEVEWRILKVLLPVERTACKRGRGRPPEENPNVINGILWRLRTGAPELDLSALSTKEQRCPGERGHRSR